MVASSSTAPDILGSRPSDYAGDVDPKEAVRILNDVPGAVLVDVRTKPEWMFVGTVDLASANKKPVLVEWQRFPAMDHNPAFKDEVLAALGEAGWQAGAPVFFLCRSGARSKAAAIAMTSSGMDACYNIAGGFEGDLDTDHHRGRKNGWKASGLSWRQG